MTCHDILFAVFIALTVWGFGSVLVALIAEIPEWFWVRVWRATTALAVVALFLVFHRMGQP